ncbi:hypothetical protein [Sediminicoccus sp. BL-A-41-H5]|uniref:hypothetical protein n=1 Tax=Sediminicoccus sp. BL-A-41-H5 TaxID=3421106 RepID=UPI003D66913D
MRALLALALLLATPAIACDPDEMERAMTEVCTAATSGAAEAVEAALPLAGADEAAALQTQLITLRRVCAEGDPALAARDAARLSRLAGRIEARAERPRPASL